MPPRGAAALQVRPLTAGRWPDMFPGGWKEVRPQDQYPAVSPAISALPKARSGRSLRAWVIAGRVPAQVRPGPVQLVRDVTKVALL
jgi:hypothetical protein